MPRFSAAQGALRDVTAGEKSGKGKMEPSQIRLKITDLTERTEALRRYL
jgi:hypothetical protein